LPDDDSFEIKTRSNVEYRSLNTVVSDVFYFIFV